MVQCPMHMIFELTMPLSWLESLPCIFTYYQAEEKEERYLKRQLRRAELEARKEEKLAHARKKAAEKSKCQLLVFFCSYAFL